MKDSPLSNADDLDELGIKSARDVRTGSSQQRWSKRMIALVLVASVCAVLFAAALVAASVLPAQDLASYWAAAHLVRQDPYSIELVGALEKSQQVAFVSPPLV